MKTITITLSSQCWLATYAGEEAAKVHSLFGSATIPTGFTPQEPASRVVAALSALNPGYTVEAR